MTEAEAKKILKTDCCYECRHGVLQGASECGNKDCPVAKATNLAIKALEKQIAKKPFVDTGKFLKCSHCHSVVRNSDKYCHECGQKLDSEV